jgi:hypothetical protein
MQVYLIYAFAIDWLDKTLFEKDKAPFLYKVFLVEMALAVCINVLLNFIWCYLIFRQVARIIFRGGDADKDFDGG